MARPYTQLASTYDATVGMPFFLHTANAFERLARRYGLNFHSAADLGCGTGLFARHLKASRKIPVMGVDLSRAMLKMAARNCCGTGVRFFQQDIRALRLPEKVDLITANFDTLNHLVEDGDLQKTFQRIADNLSPRGHLFFDIVTPSRPLGRARFLIRRFVTARHRVQQRVHWDPQKNLLSVAVVMHSPGRMTPVVEEHQERAYSPLEVAHSLRQAGFLIRGLHDASTLKIASERSPRIIVVAQKSG